LVIHPERFGLAILGNCIETGFGEDKHGAAAFRLEPELDKCRRLFRIIDLGIDRIGMPGERKQPFGLHLLHGRFPSDWLVARIGQMARRDPPRGKRSVELPPKPFAKLAVVRQRTPDPGRRGVEFDAFFDAIGHTQPPGCGSLWRGLAECATILLRMTGQAPAATSGTRRTSSPEWAR